MAGLANGLDSAGFVREAHKLTVTEQLNLPAGIPFSLGDIRQFNMHWEEADANARVAVMELPSGGNDVPVLPVGIGLDGVDLAFFDGFTQPMVATVDADRDSYVGFHYSADDVAVVRMVLASGTVRSHTIPDVASDTFMLLAAAQAVTGQKTYDDDILLRLGTTGDQVALNRSTSLGANTALTSVLIGTTVVAAIPANSLILSNITANGDQVFVALFGGTVSTEWMRADTSAGLVVFNEASADIDYRWESSSNSSIFVIDGGENAVAIGGSIVSGAAMTFKNDDARTLITAVGGVIHMPTLTYTDSGGARTVALVQAAFFGIPTFTNASNAVTGTDTSTVYIAGEPVAGTNWTATRLYALFVDAGTVRIDGTLQLGLAGNTTGVMNFQGVTSGVVTIQALAAAGTYTLSLPPDDGEASEQLQTDGSGVLTWEAAASTRDVKNIFGRLDPGEALARLLGVPVHRWTYKRGQRGVGGDYETEFVGVVADEAPWAMKHQGRHFNEINAFGHTVAAIQALYDEIAGLTQRLALAGL